MGSSITHLLRAVFLVDCVALLLLLLLAHLLLDLLRPLHVLNAAGGLVVVAVSGDERRGIGGAHGGTTVEAAELDKSKSLHVPYIQCFFRKVFESLGPNAT